MRGLRLAVLGDPVEHSRSPLIHRAALAALGMNGTYEARRVDAAGMRAAAEELRRGDLDGANITMPHKRLACELSDRVEDAAARAGSVNTWRPEGGVLAGYSTDIPGLLRAWERTGLPADGPVLVLGSGGAAAAALVALAGRSLVVSARRPEGLGPLLDRAGVVAEVVPWGRAVDGAVVVNCTPLGMRGENLPSPVVGVMAGAFDLAYGDSETRLVTTARRRGLPVADGLDLLVAQAEESFRIWTGVLPPPGIMEEAARKVSSTRREEPKQSQT